MVDSIFSNIKHLNFNKTKVKSFFFYIINYEIRLIKIPYFEYSGKQIFYQIKDTDSQNNLILIHGAGGNSNIWENQFYLNIDYNIIAIDLPSHNKSSKFPELSLDLYVDVVKQLVDSNLISIELNLPTGNVNIKNLKPFKVNSEMSNSFLLRNKYCMKVDKPPINWIDEVLENPAAIGLLSPGLSAINLVSKLF